MKDENTGRHSYGELCTAKLGGRPMGRNFMINSKWEKLTAALYFGGAQLVIDCDENDFSYGLYD